MEARAFATNDGEKLSRFIGSLRDFLARVVRDEHQILDPRLRDLAESAWSELNGEGLFERLGKDLSQGERAPQLAEHGLTGRQLDFKLATYERAVNEVSQDQVGLFKRRRLRDSVPGALRAANVTLDSVAAVFPPAGAVKEFKMGVEAAVSKRKLIARFFRGRREIEPAEREPLRVELD